MVVRVQLRTSLKEANVKLKNDMLLRGELQRSEAKFDIFQNTMMEDLRKLQISVNERKEILKKI